MDHELPVIPIWPDFSKAPTLRQWTFTATDGHYVLINTIVAVAIGLTQSRVERIFLHFIGYVGYWCPKIRLTVRQRTQQVPNDPTEQDSLLPRTQPRPDNYSTQQVTDEAVGEPTNGTQHNEAQEVSMSSDNTTLDRSAQRRSCFARLTTGIVSAASKVRTSWTTKKSATVISIFFIVLATLWIIAGTFLTRLPSGETALYASDKCGSWSLKDSANPVAQDDDATVQGDKELRAGQYARDCYGPSSETNLKQCLLFRKQSIASKMETGLSCPFKNDTYCSGNGYNAIKLSTIGSENGWVDSQIVGVNAQQRPMFRRTSICVPLDIEAGFVEKFQGPGHFRYNLGPVESNEYSSKYTFIQSGDPFSYDVRSYTMSTYVHVYPKNSSQNYWHPAEALQLCPRLLTDSEPYSITIMFINACRIYYKQPSEDPIFRADLKMGEDLYISANSSARPLACIDWLDMRTTQGRQVLPYPTQNKANSTLDDFHDFDRYDTFVQYAMNRSTTYYAIEARGAASLDAQSKIRGDQVLPLSEDPAQWMIESWSMFNTSLARIQFDAFDIANGTGRDNPTYSAKMPSNMQEQMCKIFSFQIPKGYHNIEVWSLFVEVTVLLFVAIVLGWETRTDFNEDMKQSGWFDNMKLLVYEKLLAWIWSSIKWIWTKVDQFLRGQSAQMPQPQQSQQQGQAQPQPQASSSGDAQQQTRRYDTFDATDQPPQAQQQPAYPATSSPADPDPETRSGT